MSGNNKQTDKSNNVLIDNEIYPDAKSLFRSGPTSLDGFKKDCMVVLDTNILLTPYSTGSKSLEEIEETLRFLISNKRLVIPGQVAREYVNNRAGRFTDLYDEIEKKITSIKALELPSNPLLRALPEYKQLQEMKKEANKKTEEYKKLLQGIQSYIKKWLWNDPVSQMYAKLFTDDVVLEIEWNPEEVSKRLDKHTSHKIPPGYKDASKGNGGVGDLLIWLTILKIGETNKKDLLFVSGDDKADWKYNSNNKGLYPRYELIDEYRRVSDGRFFHIMSFADFLDFFEASEDVVEEVRQEEEKAAVVKRGIELSRLVSGGLMQEQDASYLKELIRSNPLSRLEEEQIQQLKAILQPPDLGWIVEENQRQMSEALRSVSTHMFKEEQMQQMLQPPDLGWIVEENQRQMSEALRSLSSTGLKEEQRRRKNNPRRPLSDETTGEGATNKNSDAESDNSTD